MTHDAAQDWQHIFLSLNFASFGCARLVGKGTGRINSEAGPTTNWSWPPFDALTFGKVRTKTGNLIMQQWVTNMSMCILCSTDQLCRVLSNTSRSSGNFSCRCEYDNGRHVSFSSEWARKSLFHFQAYLPRQFCFFMVFLILKLFSAKNKKRQRAFLCLFTTFFCFLQKFQTLRNHEHLPCQSGFDVNPGHSGLLSTTYLIHCHAAMLFMHRAHAHRQQLGIAMI